MPPTIIQFPLYKLPVRKVPNSHSSELFRYLGVFIVLVFIILLLLGLAGVEPRRVKIFFQKCHAYTRKKWRSYMAFFRKKTSQRRKNHQNPAKVNNTKKQKASEPNPMSLTIKDKKTQNYSTAKPQSLPSAVGPPEVVKEESRCIKLLVDKRNSGRKRKKNASEVAAVAPANVLVEDSRREAVNAGTLNRHIGARFVKPIVEMAHVASEEESNTTVGDGELSERCSSDTEAEEEPGMEACASMRKTAATEKASGKVAEVVPKMKAPEAKLPVDVRPADDAERRSAAEKAAEAHPTKKKAPSPEEKGVYQVYRSFADVVSGKRVILVDVVKTSDVPQDTVPNEGHEHSTTEASTPCATEFDGPVVGESDCPVAESDCPVAEPDFAVAEPGFPVVESDYPIGEPECPVTNSGCPAAESDFPVVAPDLPVAESDCPDTESSCQGAESDCALTESYCEVAAPLDDASTLGILNSDATEHVISEVISDGVQGPPSGKRWASFFDDEEDNEANEYNQSEDSPRGDVDEGMDEDVDEDDAPPCDEDDDVSDVPSEGKKKNKDKVYTEAHRSLGMVVAKVRHRYYIVQGLDGGWHRLDRKEVSRDQPLYVGQLLTFRYRCHSHRRTAVQAAALDWHSAARVQWAEFMGIPSCLLKVEVDGDVTVLHDGDECKLGADAPSHKGDFFKAGRQIHMPMFIADDF